MLNGRTLRFGSYIDDISVLKASIRLTELIFWWGLGTKTALFPKRKEKSLFAQSSGAEVGPLAKTPHSHRLGLA